MFKHLVVLVVVFLLFSKQKEQVTDIDGVSILLGLVFLFHTLRFPNFGTLSSYFDFLFAEDTENRMDKVLAFMVFIFLSVK